VKPSELPGPPALSRHFACNQTYLGIILAIITIVSCLKEEDCEKGIHIVNGSDERRTFERFNIGVTARVDVVVNGHNRRTFFCPIYNVSAGGIFLNTAEHIEDHADVEIEIILPFEDPPNHPGVQQRVRITATGKVLRREGSGLVVRFNEDFEIDMADAGSEETNPVKRRSVADNADPWI